MLANGINIMIFKQLKKKDKNIIQIKYYIYHKIKYDII